jgi:iron complex transport system permease protein
MMTKVTLDLDRLVSAGKLDGDEAARLKALAEPGRAVSTLVQVLYILGALGLAAGIVALKPDPSTILVLALAALGFALWVQAKNNESLSVLGSAMAIAGTFGTAAWLVLQYGEVWPAMIINAVITCMVLASALWFRSLFMIAFVPLGIASMLGSGTAYWHASYFLFVSEPFITTCVFGLLSLAGFALAKRGDGIRSRQALIAGRVSWLMMNFALWVGSLWGDNVGQNIRAAWQGRDPNWDNEADAALTLFHIPDWGIVIAWAAISIATILGLKGNRFAVNAAITFLAINAYTQFFERFADSALALLTGGITLLAFAFGLFHFDKWAQSRAEGKAG